MEALNPFLHLRILILMPQVELQLDLDGGIVYDGHWETTLVALHRNPPKIELLLLYEDFRNPRGHMEGNPKHPTRPKLYHYVSLDDLIVNKILLLVSVSEWKRTTKSMVYSPTILPSVGKTLHP